MKQCKTLLSIVMAIMMLLTMMIPTLAASGTNDNTGKITIDNAVAGQEYSVYQLLVLESFDTEKPAYSYKVATKWAGFFTESVSIDGETVKILNEYVSIDAKGYVTWIKKDTSGNNIGADEFAKYAAAYAKEDSIVAEATKTAEAGKTLEFSGLNLGYYLVDTSLGTLCSLDTTAKEVNIQEKNAVPENEKKVEEDSTPDVYGSSNDADIGQTVKFQSTITAQAGAENYVFHDKMSAGLTFGSVTGITLNNVAVDAKYYTVKKTDLTDDCTFEVIFTQEFCDTLKANDKIVISYTATVNDEAVVGLTGNPNTSKVSYGDSTNTKYTPDSTTTTYTWDLDILKYANGKKENTLAGVKFVLLNNDKSKVATFETNGKLTGWETVPTAVNGVIPWSDGSILTTNTDGKIEIEGLDADTYYLREIEALPGYNVLSGDVTVPITGATLDEDGKLTYTTKVIEVENKSGTELPSTGGIGTTIFYCVGATMALGAFVLLVTKKRMGRE